MRVCIETSTFRAKLAGIAYYTLFLASHLRKVAPDIELFEFDGARFAPLTQERLDTVHYRGSAADRQTVSLYHHARQFGPARSAFRAYKRLRFRRGVHGFDLFHAMNFMPPAETTVPVLPLIHDISHERFPETHPTERTAWLRKRMARLGCYPLLNTVSDFSANEISAFYGYPRERIRVTHPGINPIFRHPPPEASSQYLHRSGLQEGCFFLCVGTIEPRKNLPTLFEAYARLPAATRQAFPLVHVGQVGWGSARSSHVDSLASEGSLRLHGYADEATLQVLYSAARAFLFPSLYEGFGIPVAEAMAAGLPVIVSDIPVMTEVAGSTARFVAPMDAGAWADAIREAIDEDHGQREARRAAVQRASKAFSWETTAWQTAAIYRELA